jgi:hypothetical protein
MSIKGIHLSIFSVSTFGLKFSLNPVKILKIALSFFFFWKKEKKLLGFRYLSEFNGIYKNTHAWIIEIFYKIFIKKINTWLF